MPLETPSRLVRELAGRGYNAEKEAVTLLAGASDPARALEAAIEQTPETALRLTAEDARAALETAADPPVSTGTTTASPSDADDTSPVETGGSEVVDGARASVDTADVTDRESVPDEPSRDGTVNSDGERAGASGVEPAQGGDDSTDDQLVAVSGDITGYSTGTGQYSDFVKTFRDRYERLSPMLKGRVNHRPTEAIQAMPGGSDAAMIGLVNDLRSTAGGHWLIELEDTTGTFPCLVMSDREFASEVDEILMDECLAVEGTLADDGGILFVDSLYFPNVPRTHEPSTADRPVQAALISDIHVGSDEFMSGAWERFAEWLHTPEADRIEYLLIAGDMVEGVGVYPDQDDELDIVDIYDQYEAFAERLKSVPGDLEIVLTPGNHDAVRLAEPQPGFDEQLRSIMDVHDARIHGNPATVDIEGVSILMYHGVSLDEVIAELPDEKASYDNPDRAMNQLLKKRHVAPQYGNHMRLAPENQDYLVIEDVPDVFHTGHVHKLGWSKYHGVLSINSGCWQAQTDFQRSVNIDPDSGYAPILNLDTLEMTVRKFS